jgi:hypothetical protein
MYMHRDILRDLACVGDFPLPHPSPVVGSKRERDSDSPKSAATPEYPMSQDASAPPHKVSRPQSFISSRRPTSQTQVAMQTTEFGQILEPMPLLPNPNFMQQHPTASGSGANLAGVPQWFTSQPDMSGAGDGSHPGSTFGSPAPVQPVLQQLFGTGADTSQQVYPQSAPQFGGSFAPQDGQDVYPNGANGMPTGVQNHTWGDTLNMWSTAPTGFECVFGQCQTREIVADVWFLDGKIGTPSPQI